jgi:cystathionine beta-lyase/cystathionine gamma-synthase
MVLGNDDIRRDLGKSQCFNGVDAIKKPRDLAVSLGFYKTLFSAPGTSTSSEIPLEEQEMGLTDGLIRFSIGLDNDIERTYHDEGVHERTFDFIKELR